MTVSAVQHCVDLLRKYNVPENIVQHSWKVYEIAMYLGKKLKEAGEDIDLNLVAQAALLHDIDKMETLSNQKNHGDETRRILIEEGMPNVAEIAAKHHLITILGKNALKTWEEKIVFYADKRVTHDMIVPLHSRFMYLRKRYGERSPEAMEQIKEAEPKVLALEKEIFGRIKANKSLSELK